MAASYGHKPKRWKTIIFFLLVSGAGIYAVSQGLPRDFLDAARRDTPEAYRQFLTKHANLDKNPLALEAHQRIRALASEAWLGAQTVHTVEGYRYFAGRFPESEHLVEARRRWHDLWWRQLVSRNAPSAEYDDFLRLFPDSSNAAAARVRGEPAAREHALQPSATVQDLEDFLKFYPLTSARATVNRRLEPLLWSELLKDRTNLTRWRTFAQLFPSSYHMPEVRTVLGASPGEFKETKVSRPVRESEVVRESRLESVRGPAR